ncbi:MAG: hypothetical protein H6Q99_3274 [Proteobacteria bacterium]|nr:hypothetical protein [Pseudomonadota bacterium]
MTNLLTGKRYALLAVAVLSLSACSALGTSVAEDDSETEVPNASMGRAVMESLGAVPARKTAINYTPRAPLVVPPDHLALVAPEDPKRLEASGTWPEDNDLKSQRILAEASAREAARGEDEPQLSPSELTAVRLPQNTSRPMSAPNSLEEQAKPIMPSQLGDMPRENKNRLYDANGKPIRKALVEPPVAYLEPAAGVPVTTDDGSPAAPKKSWWKFW